MTAWRRLHVVKAGVKRFGLDFYMVDPRRDVRILAASFHIENDQDRDVFAHFASSIIPWKASPTANLESSYYEN